MLKYRLPSGLLLGAVILVAIFVDGPVGKGLFLLFGAFLVFAAVREYLGMLEAMGMKSFPIATASFSALVLVGLVLNAPPVTFVSAGAAATLFSWLAFLNPENRRESVSKVVHSLSALPLLVFPLSFLALIYNGDSFGANGRILLFFMILVTKCGDIGAYSFGTLSSKIMPGGNHKIIPSISPKKSWEGTLCGLLTSVAASLAFCGFAPDTVVHGYDPMLFPLLTGALLFVGGFFGDLVESSLKRAAEVKDSGKMIPGMGGALDIIDSLLLNAPLFYLFLIS